MPNNGGPAFPTVTPRYGSGMTLRDYYAGQALVGLLSARFSMSLVDDERARIDCANAAEGAYRVADAMLKERLR